MIQDQQADPELVALAWETLTEKEAQDNPICYFKRSGALMHKWRPPNVPATDDWKITYQIIVPSNCRREVLELALSTTLPGHLGHTVRF